MCCDIRLVLGSGVEDLEKELSGARAEFAAGQKYPGQAKAPLIETATARLAAAQAKAQALKPVGVRIKTAQDRLDGLRGRAAGLAAERLAALARLEKLDPNLAEVSGDGQVA